MLSRNTPILLVLTILFALPGLAQSPGIEWQKTYGGNTSDFLSTTILTSDNYFIVAGTCARSGRGNDIRVSKLTKEGTVIWNKYLGGTGNESFYRLVSTPDGGFMFAGTTLSSDGDVTGFHGTSTGSNPDVWIVKLSASGAIQWQKCIGSSSRDQIRQLIVQADGSSLILGICDGIGDFPGDGPFLMKLDQNGGVVSAQSLGSYRVAYNKMMVRPDGKVFLVGQNILLGNLGSVDLSYGVVNQDGSWPTGNCPAGVTLGGYADDIGFDVVQTGAEQFTVLGTSLSPTVPGAHGQTDVWLITFNSCGKVLWQKSLGGSGEDALGTPSIYYNSADSSIRVVTVTNSNDGDISGNHGASDIWVAKLSNAGNILWSRCLGGSGYESFAQLQMDNADQTYILGTTASNNGDVTGHHGGQDTWFVKLNADGSLGWQKALGGSLNEKPGFFKMEPNGFTLLGSTPSNDGDVQGMHYKSDTVGVNITYNDDIWAVNLNNNGELRWQKPLGGSGNEVPGNVFNIDGKYYVTGTARSNDGDVFPLQGLSSWWLVKLGPTNVIKGNVFVDVNGNGIKDAGEYYYNDVIVKSEKPGYSRSGIPYDGHFKLDVDTGTFTTSVILNKPYYTVVTVPHVSTFANYFLVDSVDFILQPIAGKRDVQVDIINTSAARPGFKSSYSIHYKNIGSETIATGKVTMIKDSAATFVSAVPVPDSQTGDTLVWNYNNLLPEQSAAITVVLNNKIPPAVNIGDTMVHTVFIEPETGDLQSVNNSDTIRQIVTGSYDPNDKSESHAGSISPAAVKNGEELSYVINFQNVGTDTAFKVVVIDTLSNKLDWNSIEIIGASHPWTLQIADNNKLTWTFDNIGLPHAAINEPASHGYIAYRIKPKTNLVIGDVINNQASIYFDFNPPIVTNLVSTLVKPDPVAQPVISGLVNNYCGNVAVQKIKLLNLPDNSTTVTVKLDNTVLTVAADSTVSVAPGSLTGGTHTLSVSYSNITDTKTTAANFVITTAATPNVNLTASTTNVVTLANPVVVTATNASGGGKNPLYTFAWNNSFTNIVQAESSNTSLTIPASSLALGDNKVYVKMKTSEDCYTAQTNIDSITIRRDMSTGITDTDNPGQVITVYPNPVNGPITINGLSTGKTYTFTIVNLQGQVAFTKRVANQSSANITEFKGAAGTYWLTIYDEKNHRKLGSVKMIKQ